MTDYNDSTYNDFTKNDYKWTQLCFLSIYTICKLVIYCYK